jgi:hypothetical protein
MLRKSWIGRFGTAVGKQIGAFVLESDMKQAQRFSRKTRLAYASLSDEQVGAQIRFALTSALAPQVPVRNPDVCPASLK